MTKEQFTQMFITLINWGWSGEYADFLLTLANDAAKLTKVFNRAKLAAYRNCISEHDALVHLISTGKLRNI